MLSLFPLNLVAFPHEKMNLHIFEPRYRQLIKECLTRQSNFGISPFIDNKIEEYGTEVKIISLEKEYEDGRMDVRTQGMRVYHLLSYENPTPGKLYAAGVVAYVDQEEETPPFDLTTDLLNHLTQLYGLLQLKFDVVIEQISSLSFEVAHKIGLSVEQEYELLTIPGETERQRYLLDHLSRVIPVVSDMEKTKERIRMNGHFKSLDPLNF
jgi:Lon protease-like protein